MFADYNLRLSICDSTSCALRLISTETLLSAIVRLYRIPHALASLSFPSQYMPSDDTALRCLSLHWRRSWINIQAIACISSVDASCHIIYSDTMHQNALE